MVLGLLTLLQELALTIPSPSANAISDFSLLFKKQSKLSFRYLIASKKLSSFYFIVLIGSILPWLPITQSLFTRLTVLLPRTVLTPHHPVQQSSLSFAHCWFMFHEDGDHINLTHHCIFPAPWSEPGIVFNSLLSEWANERVPRSPEGLSLHCFFV